MFELIHANKAFIVPRVVNDSVSSRCRKLVERNRTLFALNASVIRLELWDYLPNHTTYDEHATISH